ncbi:30S ribosomal protein S21 [Patescibacteria group bacterium]|nr:30S ribosomal protein S21 [Patescibacteria group bacterium]HOM78068.1 30S ribosomal protein S21 [bacterium]
MTKVKVRKGESFDHALKRFIMEVNKAGVLKETKLRERFTKESQIRRQKREEKARTIKSDRRKYN